MLTRSNGYHVEPLVRERRSSDLDVTDIRILKELQNNGKMTNIELSGRVHLSASPCLARVRTLERTGYISNYVALLNPLKVGLSVIAFIHVTLDKQIGKYLEEFERNMQQHPEVMECYLMAGDCDYLIRVAVADLQALEKFVTSELTMIPCVAQIRSNIALKHVKYQTALPLPVRAS